MIHRVRTFGMIAATSLAVFVAMSAIASATTAKAYVSGSNGSCWGYETQEFAQTGTLGEHASSQDTPRTGLGNLMQLFEDGFAGLIFFLTGESC